MSPVSFGISIHPTAAIRNSFSHRSNSVSFSLSREFLSTRNALVVVHEEDATPGLSRRQEACPEAADQSPRLEARERTQVAWSQQGHLDSAEAGGFHRWTSVTSTDVFPVPRSPSNRRTRR